MECEIIKSRKSAVDEGEHYILQCMDMRAEVSEEEELELYKEALSFAKENSEKLRYRIAINGKGERHNKHFHIHIVLPKGDDKLIRIIEKYEENKINN